MRSVAFLGGINVGGNHLVKMDRLRAMFEHLGLDSVSTFIASGNVIFTSDTRGAALESLIEGHLAGELGFDVPTFVRSAASVKKTAAHVPAGRTDGDSHYVSFMRKKLPAAQTTALLALSNDVDRFSVTGAEFHWLVRGKTADSTIKPGVLGRTVGQAFTTRNITSLRKLVAKLDG